MFDKEASYCRLVYKIEHLLGLGWEQYVHKNTIEEKPSDLRSVEIWKRKTKAAQKEDLEREEVCMIMIQGF